MRRQGLVEKAPSPNSVFRYLERADLAPLLKTLMHESAAPLRAVETAFAVDRTGFATSTYARWFDGQERRVAPALAHVRGAERSVPRPLPQALNVESVFSAVKRKFGASGRAKAPAAQVNEMLLKCLAYNLSVLMHAIHELKIAPSFWARLEAA